MISRSLISIILACTIKFHVANHSNENFFSRNWEIGSCYGPKRIYDEQTKSFSDQYEANKTYIDNCCLTPGVYTLRCMNLEGPYGWGKSFLEIQGQRYCDDFVGSKGLRRIDIKGTSNHLI